MPKEKGVISSIHWENIIIYLSVLGYSVIIDKGDYYPRDSLKKTKDWRIHIETDKNIYIYIIILYWILNRKNNNYFSVFFFLSLNKTLDSNMKKAMCKVYIAGREEQRNYFLIQKRKRYAE